MEMASGTILIVVWCIAFICKNEHPKEKIPVIIIYNELQSLRGTKGRPLAGVPNPRKILTLHDNPESVLQSLFSLVLN